MDNRHRAIQINHVDGEPHAQSMNAVAGNNPQAEAVTEVIRAESEQAAQPRPVRVGHRQRGGQVRLAALVEGPAVRGKKRHKMQMLPSSVQLSVRPFYFPPETGPSCRISSMMAGPIVTKIIEGRTNITSGGTILMVVFAACSSARCRRSVRRESECTRRAWATLVPKRSVCTRVATRARISLTPVR